MRASWGEIQWDVNDQEDNYIGIFSISFFALSLYLISLYRFPPLRSYFYILLYSVTVGLIITFIVVEVDTLFILTKSQAKATEFSGALHNGQGGGAGAILTSQ